MNGNLAIIEQLEWRNMASLYDFYVRAEPADANISQHPDNTSFFRYQFQPNESLTIRLLSFINDKAITDYDLCFVPGIKDGDPGSTDDFIIIHKRSELP